jgi:beta-lactamase superfamily II metal-dependent hydrolase
MSKKNSRVYLAFYFLLYLSSCHSPNRQQTNISSNPATASHLEIHIIDVGQGDCFLIITPSGKKIIIDAGNTGRGAGFVLPYLKDHNISSIDYIIASHFHSDHIGGLDEVVNGLGGSTHILSAAFDRGGNYDSGAFRDYIKSIGDKRKTISPGQMIELGDDIKMKCIASNGDTPGGKAYSGTDENALSVVLLLKYRTFDMYLGGDSNSAIEPSLVPYAGDVDVYKVSHHGSATSSTQRLLDCLKPEVSVITVGDGNTYGHPNSGTISRLVAVNSYVYQTESGAAVPPPGKGEIANGNFLIIADGYSYTISGSSLVSKTRPTDSSQAFACLTGKHSRQWPFLFLVSEN